mmetsp:Transcript_4358/g.13595  ORF Transcript_4358/g.13595 Transcript_4358/m.13595 type:complete len:482 (-) Transcript_4358:335-1780(-)
MGPASAPDFPVEPSAFEGPEKTLEVCFTPGIGDPRGCRALERPALDAILAEARCEILSETSNSYLDAYVLSESSLFVYPHKVVIKTCGRTTLLRCLRRLVEFATGEIVGNDSVRVGDEDDSSSKDASSSPKDNPGDLDEVFHNDDEFPADVSDGATQRVPSLGLRLEWVGYSRKNYVFPDEQPSPHTSFGEELAYLKAHGTKDDDSDDDDASNSGHSAAFDGSGYVLGPITGDHWFVYVSDQCERPSFMATERTINVMMFDLPDDVRRAFYLRPDELESGALPGAAKRMTRASGLDAIVHTENGAANVDAHAFAPCGYSMNALCFESYTTVHVTPEPQCSYASFETNTALKAYGSLVKNVLAVFKPARVVLTLFADEAGLAELPRTATFDGMPRLDVANVGTYQRADFSSLHVECDCVCFMANYILLNATPNGLNNRGALKSSNLAAALGGKRRPRGPTWGTRVASRENVKKHESHVGSLQ